VAIRPNTGGSKLTTMTLAPLPSPPGAGHLRSWLGGENFPAATVVTCSLPPRQKADAGSRFKVPASSNAWPVPFLEL